LLTFPRIFAACGRGKDRKMGTALFAAQQGETDPAAKPLKGLGGASVLEIVARGPKGNPTGANLFNIIACLQEQEGVRLRVVA